MSEVQESEVKRGRPPKKGAKSWQPSNLGDVIEKEQGFRYRRVRKDDENIAKKLEEGWEYVNGINGQKTQAIHPSSRPDEPHKLTSSVEGRDWVAMRLPEDVAEARDEYHNSKVSRLERRLYQDTKKELGKEGAQVHGSLSKEQRGIKTIIE